MITPASSTSNAPPELTDRKAVLRNRMRAQATGAELFLHHDVADEIEERLFEVNRTFTRPAIVTGFPEVWANRLQDAAIVADDDRLDLREGAHDLVIHMMGLHWANDPVGQLVQCRRALKPDGLFIAAFFGGQTLSELRGALAEAEAAILGGLSPRVAPMGEIRDLGALLQRAGFALPVADSGIRNVTYPDLFRLMHDLRAMGEGNALSARMRNVAPRSLFAEAATRYQAAFGLPDGRLPATFEVIMLTGWSPDDSQPRPLRPGSAPARLADALNAVEIPLDEGANPDQTD